MLNIKIALRFIFKKPLQYLFILFVVTIGVAIFYFIYNASDGLKKIVLQATAENSSYINVKGDFEFNSYDDDIITQLRTEAFENDNRITDISYTLSVSAQLNRLWLESNNTILIKGIDFNEGGNIQAIRKRINGNSLNSVPKTLDNDKNYFGEIVLGHRLMENLGFTSIEHAIGKPLKIDLLLSGNKVESFVFKIVAVHVTDQIELSEKLAFTTIETLHKINEFKGKANSIEISTTNPLNSDDVSYKLDFILNKYYDDYSLNNWQEGNKYIVNALYIEDISIILIQVFTALAISFGLASIITFTIREKNNQIGVLKALGTTNRKIIKIFLYQILLILIIGIYLGLNLGNYMSLSFMKIFKRPNSNLPLVSLTIGIKNRFSYITALTMLLSSILASLIPLKMAERLKIIEVIKSE